MKTPILALLAALFCASYAHARAGLELTGAYNAYSMGDINDALKAAYASGDLSHGAQVGLGLRYGFSDHLYGNVEVDYLMAQATASGVSGTAVNLPAYSVGVGASWVLPLFAGLSVRALGMLSYDVLNQATYSSNTAPTFNLNGSTIGAQVAAGADYDFNEHYTLGASLGYRYSRISGLGTAPDGTAVGTADFSGLVAKVGLVYWFM